MSCRCEHKKLMSDLERVRRLAKGCAILEGATVGIFQRKDGTYDFELADKTDKPLIEFITPY